MKIPVVVELEIAIVWAVQHCDYDNLIAVELRAGQVVLQHHFVVVVAIQRLFH